MTSSSSNLRGQAEQAIIPSESSGLALLAGHNIDGTNVSWMETNWPFFSWAIFLIGTGLLVGCWNTKESNQKQQQQEHYNHLWYGWLSFVAYCLHQSEEHAYDIYGWRYSFVPALNLGPIKAIFMEVCGDGPHVMDPVTDKTIISCPVDPKITLYVNVVAIWIGFGGCMLMATFFSKYYQSSRFLFVAYLNWGSAFVNGLMGHIMPMILTHTYNPGVVQSIFMVPFALWLIVWKSNYQQLPFLCILNGVLMHILLISSVQIIFRFKTSEAITITVFMITGTVFVPLAISNYVYNNVTTTPTTTTTTITSTSSSKKA